MRALGLALLAACGPTITDPPAVSTSAGTGVAQWVDPFIGTTSANVSNPVPNGAGGSTNPSAALPFGMVQWGPDTPNAVPAGYEYADTTITAFSVTHMSGAGCSAMRDFPIFPLVGDWDTTVDPSATFSHGSELASAGFYEVDARLEDQSRSHGDRAHRLRALHVPARRSRQGARRRQVTSTTACWSRTRSSTLRDDGVIVGHRTSSLFCGTPTGYVVHFAARFDRVPNGFGAYASDGAVEGVRQSSGPGSGLWLSFDTSSNAAVQMKVGLSYVSDDAALANLDAESAGWDFDAVHTAAVGAWDDALGRVAVLGGADDDRRAFYTALYHVMLHPNLASDVDGSYMGMDDKVHVVPSGARYQNYSGWDVYHSWIQLVAAIAPERTSDIVRSLVDAGTECGVMPRWAIANKEASEMVGDPASAIVSNAYAFGVRGFDASAALSMMVQAATNPSAACQGHVVRPGLGDELARQFLALDAPSPATGTASTTIEYAIDDFAIAQLAKALGDDATHTTFMTRAGWWKNVFDAARDANGFVGYVQPRYDADVSGQPHFREGDVTTYDPFDITGASGFTEGNATQYTFGVPHDLVGLGVALGGDASFVARLDAFFTQVNAGLEQPYMYIGNEPNFATPWEYDFVGAPSKTQAVVRRILREAYSTQPSGLPGNDDLGAMSAWQVWAMLGMYPVIPGASGVVLGSPTFTKTTLTLAGGKTLVIIGENAAPDAPYVQSMTIGGTPTTSAWVDWPTLAAGTTIDMVLGNTPSAWGTGASDRPPAFQ